MDLLHLHNVTFPVVRGTLSKLRELGDYCWDIEIYCGKSAQLDYCDDRDEQELDWLVGSEPYLYAQLLPLRVGSPGELVGRRYSFPQSPDDSTADWEPNQWPFFCLYLTEHEYAHPMTLAFTAMRGRQYRVEIEGKLPVNNVRYDLRVHAWLDWK
jgi:hypothetical protein